MTSQEIILCRGFAQPKRISDGMGAAYERLVAGQMELPQPTHVEILRWTANPQKVASEIAHERNPHNDARTIVCGHSAGGRWANSLALWLYEFGIHVDAMFLADAWDNDGVIQVSPNVIELYSWRQTEGRPRGSKLIVDTLTRHVVDRIVERKHWQVDEEPELHALLWAAACEPLEA